MGTTSSTCRQTFKSSRKRNKASKAPIPMSRPLLPPTGEYPSTPPKLVATDLQLARAIAACHAAAAEAMAAVKDADHRRILAAGFDINCALHGLDAAKVRYGAADENHMHAKKKLLAEAAEARQVCVLDVWREVKRLEAAQEVGKVEPQWEEVRRWLVGRGRGASRGQKRMQPL